MYMVIQGGAVTSSSDAPYLSNPRNAEHVVHTFGTLSTWFILSGSSSPYIKRSLLASVGVVCTVHFAYFTFPMSISLKLLALRLSMATLHSHDCQLFAYDGRLKRDDSSNGDQLVHKAVGLVTGCSLS